MFKLNKDILYLILEEVQDDKQSLHSCIFVNKTWCEIIVPILWKNPWKYLAERKVDILFNIIISHLSDESVNNLKSQEIYLLTDSYQKRPSFNYISFCRNLDLYEFIRMVEMF